MNFSHVKINKSGIVFILLAVSVTFYYVIFVLNGEDVSAVQDTVDLRRLLIGGIQAAVEGGHQVTSIFNSSKWNVQSKGLTKEGANNPVTEADLQSHCAMYYGLTRTFRRITIISEEKVDETKCLPLHNFDLDPTVLQTSFDVSSELVPVKDITVWIDPLDATQEFTEKLVEYVTTMVCIAVKGVPTIGIIHFPFSGVTSWAWVGRHTPVKRAGYKGKLKIITSRSHKGDVASVVKKALGDDVNVIHAGGAGYKSLQVASGNVSAYVHTTHIKKWDICAGDATLRALGGSMTTLTGEDINYSSDSDPVNRNGILASLATHPLLLSKFAAVSPLPSV